MVRCRSNFNDMFIKANPSTSIDLGRFLTLSVQVELLAASHRPTNWGPKPEFGFDLGHCDDFATIRHDRIKVAEPGLMTHRIFQLFLTTFRIWSEANASRMSAAMTYYTMLSLAPLLLIAIAIAGYVFDNQAIESAILQNVRAFTTPDIANTVAAVMRNASEPSSGLLASTISLVVLFYAASGIFTQLSDTLDEIWQVPKADRRGIKFNVQKRMIGVAMVLVAGVLLIGSLTLDTVLACLNQWLEGTYPTLRTWLGLADRGLSFVLIPLVLSLIFCFFPSQKIRWSDCLPAAGLTAVLMVASRYFINLYLKFSSTSELYGAAGSLVVLLIWVYVIGLVVFFGAGFSCAWTKTFGETRNEESGPETIPIHGTRFGTSTAQPLKVRRRA